MFLPFSLREAGLLGVLLCVLIDSSNFRASALKVNYARPRSVSLAGGAKVTIYGNGFSPNQYDLANLVFIGGTPCDVDWFNSASEDRIVCWTRPWADAVEDTSSDYLRVQVFVGRESVTKESHVRYWRWRTPKIEAVLPSSSPPGSVVELNGWFVSDDATKIQRVLVGNDVCDMYKPDSSILYRANELDFYKVTCRVASVKVGFYNATVQIPEFGGCSWNYSKSLQPGPDGRLFMYEIHPDVTNVYPRMGSSEGGTLLRISGSGFGSKVDKISVDVGGVPCDVQTVSTSLVTCITRSPPSGSAAILGVNGSFELETGLFFEGARGAGMKVWRGLDGTLVSTLTALDSYPHAPDVFYNVEVFASPQYNDDLYGVELEAFFTAHYDSWHSFYFASDDNGELWFANTTNSSEARKIAFVRGYTRVNQYTKYYGEQISNPVYLMKGQKCYLKALAKEHVGNDFVKAAVLVHNPGLEYTSKQTKSAVAEHQQAITSATVFNEIQSITVNYSSSTSHLMSAFHLEWGSQQSIQLNVNAGNEEIRQAVLGFFEGKCTVVQGDPNDWYDIDTFEEGEEERWNVLSGKTRPNVVYSDAYCGRKCLEVVSGYAENFDGKDGLEDFQNEFGYATLDYPYICMAYRIPHGTHAALAVRVNDLGWRSIPVTDFMDALPFPYLASWLDVNGEHIRDDNRWHYSCFDLDAALETAFGVGLHYTVVGVGFASPAPQYRNGPFYIDEFAISSVVRDLQQISRPARPNGLVLSDVLVSNVTAVHGDSKSITFELEYEATTCFDNYSLIEVVASRQAKSQGVVVSSRVEKNASHAIRGTFRLGMFGNWTPEIRYDANQEELKLALESIREVGEVTVYDWRHDSKRACSGRGWNIYFTHLPNDLPLMKVNSSLQGENVNAYTKEYTNGGILFDPIPGYMLHTVERTPQVQVTVNGVHASCQGSSEAVHATRYSHNTSCQFAYSRDARPVVTSLSPESGFPGDIVTITGTGFDTNIKEYDIHFGSAPCFVRNASMTTVQCVVQESYAGKHQLHFLVLLSGRANTTGLSFKYKLNFSLSEPSAGSIGGGLVATLSGHGFISVNGDNQLYPNQQVLFGGNPCAITSSHHSQLQCIVPEGDAAGSVSVSVTVTTEDGEMTSFTAVDHYTYSDMLTPHVTSIVPNTGSAAGGTIVAIIGSGFSNIVANNSVKIGSVECVVLSATNATIMCETGPNEPGTYGAVVFVTGSGNSIPVLNFTYHLRVDDFSHFSGSVFGGQHIRVSGAGFGFNSSLVSVRLGKVPCKIESVADDSIECVTRSSAVTHHVDNLGRHPVYGVGYQWRPQHITIQEGDRVEWQWNGSPYTVERSVVQVADEDATDYDGSGFHSEARIDGRFRHTFDKPGVYHYISEGHGAIGFRGSVIVNSFRTTVVPINVSVNGISATHSNHLVNRSVTSLWMSCENDTEIPENGWDVAYYSYSICVTPVIVEVRPSIVQLGGEIVVVGERFADQPYSDSLNTLTVGGKACLWPQDARPSDRPSSNVTLLTDTQIGLKNEINCTVPKRPPGRYRVVVHVAGRGWGYGSLNASTVEYRPAFSVNVTSGSVHGGTEVMLLGVGFHPKSSLGNIVRIGGTVCDVQSLTDLDEWGDGGRLTCITRRSLRDGYAAIVHKSTPLGYWEMNDRVWEGDGGLLSLISKNSGSLGPHGDGSFHGDVETGIDGISGNNWTNTAVRFNDSWVSVPYIHELNNATSLSGELWIMPESFVWAYQLVLGSFRGGMVSQGYAIWINPCQELEFWLAVDARVGPGNSSCGGPNVADNKSAVVGADLNSCGECNGVRTVLPHESEKTGFPAGVWSVITGPQLGSVWSHVVFSWTHDDSSLSVGVGVQALYVDGVLQDERRTNFSHNRESPLLIGGHSISDDKEDDGDDDDDDDDDHDALIAPFAGVLDEVALYGESLSEEVISRHYFYGSNEEQQVSVQYQMEDHIGIGTVPNVKYPPPPVDYTDVTVNWTSIASNATHIKTSERLQFVWIGFHSVVEVSQREFKSCTQDLTEKRVMWGLSRSDGAVTVAGLESGLNHYFISDVAGDCEQGHKMMVFVGSERVINWRLGQVYNPMSIPYGTGLRFQWSSGPGVYHDVVEVANEEALEECAVGQVAQTSGSVITRYSQPVTTGDVPIAGLSVGTHYFACAVSGHCAAGMHVVVTVTGERDSDAAEDDSRSQLYETVHIHWRIVAYSDIVITEGDSVVFEWDEFHSLSQVGKAAYDGCDISSKPLKEWARPSVTGTVKISGLAPGSYYFICAVAGHCGVGMKVAVIVKPRLDVPVFDFSRDAQCLRQYCSYTYEESQTPVIYNIKPEHGFSGTTLTIVGLRLLSKDFGVSSSLESVLEVRIGNSLCKNPVQVWYRNDSQSISCVVVEQEAGDKNVSVLVYGNGVSSSNNNIYKAVAPHRLFHVDASVTEITPTNGSIAGGTLVTLAGNGFSYVHSQLTVLVGGYDCIVTKSSFKEIKCMTSSVEGAPDLHDRPLQVVVFVGNSDTNSSVFYTYSTNSTPVVSNVTSSTVVAGDAITIAGTFFTAQVDDVEVYIGRTSSRFRRSTDQLRAATEHECQVQSASETEISCVVGARVAGDRYVVIVKIDNVGYAVAEPKFGANVVYKLQIDSVTPTRFGLGGGVELTVRGVGFLSGTLENKESDLTFSRAYSHADIQKAAAMAGQTLAASNFYGKLVSSYGIDYGVTYSISVCSKACYIQSSTYNLTVCIVPPSEVLSGNMSVADMLGSVRMCAVDAVVNGSSGAMRFQWHSSVSYEGSLTPRIDSVSPRQGGTAGGTILTITGSGFNSSVDSQDLVVSIEEVECSLRETSDSQIKCRTNAYKTTLNGRVSVVVPGKGAAIELHPGNATSPSSSQFEYVDRWSSPFTWGGDDPPSDGASVHIQAGQTVLLDTSPGVLSLLVVAGNLIFDDSRDIHLQSKYIFINGGRLQVGTENEPFMHRAVITLHGNVRDPEIPIYGAKVLGLRRGSLEMHGRPRVTTWTRLAETVNRNESVLELLEPVDWVEDDIIVIASTSKDGNETETANISSVENGGYRIVLQEPVNFKHYGITDVLEDGQFIDIRAEVGLLSHNVIVQGSQYIGDSIDDLGADKYGSQIMIHRAGEDPTPVRLEHVEVRHGGQAFRLGRYAVHFHLSDKMNGSYVRHCSIHHSHNRAITAHGVHEMLFEGVVAYDIMGHTFFIEDGIETGNRYIRNLGLVTRGSSSLLNTDQLPATFWITNPNNTFIGNAAAGSRAYGFWYDLDPHPVGPSYTPSVCPNQTPFGEFRDNVAHTNAEFGLRIWETYTPKEFGCSGDDVEAILYNLVSYSNGIHGVELSVVGHVKLVGFKIADNRDDGIAIQEGHGKWGGPMIKDMLIISHTLANQGNPQIGGIRTPNHRLFTFSNITFARFDDPTLSCLRACSHCKVRQGGFQYWFEKIKYLGNSSMHRAAFQWEHEVLFKDMDGTLAGVPGGWVTPTNGLLPAEYCQQRPEYSLNAAVPGSVCTSDVQLLRLAWNRAEPLETLEGRDVVVSHENGSTVIPWRHYRLTHMDGYMLTLPSHHVHNLSYVLPPSKDVDNTAYRAGLYNVPIDESVIIQTYYHTAPDHFLVGSNRKDIGRDLQFSDNHTSWHFDNETLQLQYILSAKGQTANLSDLLYPFSKEPCPVGGCPSSPIGGGSYESRWRRWSVAADWPDNRVPLSGANVTIQSPWKMYVDVAEVNVEKLEIQGKLQFEDTLDIVFNATWILIIGTNGRLVVGEEQSSFTHRATIYLKGNRRTPDLIQSRSMIVGSKAIGVFGELHLIGSRHKVMWTRLSQSAMAGDTELHLETSTPVDWKPGEEIVLAPSGYIPSEAEICTVQSVSSKVVTLQMPLQHDHVVDKFLNGTEVGTGNDASRWWHRNGGIRLAPEVGILSHNIRIIGEEDIYNSISVDEFGCRVLVGYYRRGRAEYTGKAYIDSVQFKHCGQGGFFSRRDPRYVVAFKNGLDASAGSYVKHSSVHTGFNTAFGTLASNFIEISDNVVYRSVDSMFRISSINCTVRNNLGVLTRSIQVARPSDNHAVDFPATYEIKGTGHTVKGNVAAGSERVGFYFPGESCDNDAAPDSATAKFWDNSAHSGLIGLVITGLNEQCSGVGGFVTVRQWDYGMFSSTSSRLAVRESAVGVGHTGFCLNIFGPDPVKHQLDYKWIKIDDSLVVGATEKEPCFTSKPAHCPGVSAAAGDPKLGIMMATFAKRKSKMDGTQPWHKPKSYPTIAGEVRVSSVTFARFMDYSRCGHESYVIANNKLSPDAMHPNYVEGTGLIDVDTDKIAHLYPPNPKWIVQEDCVDMDCDGPKHSMVHDVDGKLVKTSGTRGSIIPEAEIRFDISRLPEAMLYSGSDLTTRLHSDAVVDKRGIARGNDGNFDAASPGCVFMAGWNAYRCSGLNHHMLVIESMDADSEVRRVSPIALHGGDTGFGTYTDLMNGPMDHGWCTYYTCLKRLSTFFSIVAAGTDYQLWFTGSNPGHLRFHLLNTNGGPSDAPGEGIRLSIWYKNPQRKDVYKKGIYLEAENAILQPNGKVRRPSGHQYIPTLSSSHSGANYFDRDNQTLHLVIKGSEPIEVTTPPVVQVSMDLAVNLDDFFDPDTIVRNLAFVLGIPESTIRVVDVIAEDTPLSARRRRELLAQTTQPVTMVLEFGDEPASNISQPETPSVSEQTEDGGGTVFDPLADIESENVTDTTVEPPTSPTSNITAAGESVPTQDQLLKEFEQESQQYTANLQQYSTTVQETNLVNSYANMLIEKVQTGELQLENATVTGMAVAPAPPPAEPVKPVAPPGFENLTTSSGEPIYSSIDAPTAAPLLVDVEGNDSQLLFVIPTGAAVSNEPPDVSGHLVFVSVVVVDANGDPVENLGLTHPWQCDASLIYGGNDVEPPLLEGTTTVPFVDGYATFTRLRVNKAATNLRLQFVVVPSGFTAQTSTVFSVKSPDISSTDHTTVSFSFDGSLEIVAAGPGGVDGFLEELKETLSRILDIDESRLVDLKASAGSVVCTVTILERASTGPPDVPTLEATVDYLERIIEAGRLTISHGAYTFDVIRSSFGTDEDVTKETDSFPAWAIAVVAVAGGLVVVGLVVLWVKLHRSGNEPKQSLKKVYPDIRWSDSPRRSRPPSSRTVDDEQVDVETIENDVEMSQFLPQRYTSPVIPDGSVQETAWGAPEYVPPPDYDRDFTPVETTTALMEKPSLASPRASSRQTKPKGRSSRRDTKQVSVRPRSGSKS